MLRNRAPGDLHTWMPGIVWGAVAYGIHRVGVVNGYYLEFGWFQNVTHAASASGLAALIAVVAIHYGYRGRTLFGLIVLGSLVGAVGWEVVEYFGVLAPYGMHFIFHDFHDAAIDMTANAVGVTGTLLAVWYATERGISLPLRRNRTNDRDDLLD